MARPKLFWFDMTLTARHTDVNGLFPEYFDIRFGSTPDKLDFELELEQGEAVVFEFDYPDRPGLSILRNTKKRFPRVPILMLTMQHSERLAVWAFRNRVLDYLVMPVGREDLIRCKKLLQQIQNPNLRQQERMMVDVNSTIPMEVPVGQRVRHQRLAPALDFVQTNFGRKIRIAEVAEHCGMSQFHFSHEFTETFSLTFQEFVLRYRIFAACRELRHPNVAVANVAYSVGFNDPSYFARVFRRFISMAPSEYCVQMAGVGDDARMVDVLDRLELPDLEATREYARPGVSGRDSAGQGQNARNIGY